MRRTIFGMVAVICTLIMLVVSASTHSVNSSHCYISQNQPPSKLSLCNLSEDIELYQNKVVRVRATIVGMGGHYPFFVTASGCNPDKLMALYVKFQNRERTGVTLQKRIDEVLRFNLANDDHKAEAIIVGRVKKKSCKGCPTPQLLISVMDVELRMPESDDGE